MTISVTAVLRRRDRLRELFRQFWNCTFDSGEIDRLIPGIQRVLPKAGRDALFESLRHYTGREIYRAEFDHLAWLLAGGILRLESGQPVASWNGQLADEWIPVQVLRVFPSKDDYNNRGYRLSLVVLSGSPAGKVFHAIKKPPLLAALSRKVGFTKRFGSLPYTSGYQYMSLRFMVQVLAAKSQNDLVFNSVASKGELTTWNKKILRRRCRIEPCPNAFTHPCHRCIVGSDQCPAATHRLTYVSGPCVECGEAEAWFDPEAGTVCCVECLKKKEWSK